MKNNALWINVLLTGSFLAVADIAIRVASAQNDAPAPVVTAQQFRLVDKAGRMTASLDNGEDGAHPSLRLYDRSGTVRAELQVSDTTQGLTVYDPSGKPVSTPGPKAPNSPPRRVTLSGQAALYYVYQRNRVVHAQSYVAASLGKYCLYMSQNGGVYYRDAKNSTRVFWLTAPREAVAVPADELERYAPDYQQYQGRPTPPAPPGAKALPVTQYAPELFTSIGNGG